MALPDLAVAALGERAFDAGVVDLGVPVIALFFAGLYEAVTALRHLAGSEAFVGFDRVPVVALLDALLNEAVAAPRRRAILQAGVVFVVVGVVALLETQVREAITTSGSLACSRALVVVGRVAVVALFAGIHEAIAAHGLGHRRISVAAFTPCARLRDVFDIDRRAAGSGLTRDLFRRRIRRGHAARAGIGDVVRVRCSGRDFGPWHESRSSDTPRATPRACVRGLRSRARLAARVARAREGERGERDRENESKVQWSLGKA